MRRKGGMDMTNLVLNETETKMVRNVIETYISNLREEIVKTEKHEWKKRLHEEENTLDAVLAQLRAKSASLA
jgi:DNA-binding response OmpR family regulator